jgi:hypothetical protein
MKRCVRPSCDADHGGLHLAKKSTPNAITGAPMSTKIKGMVETEIYTTDDGFVAIEQPNDTVVLLSADQLLSVIRELQAYYDNRAEWQEPPRE